MVHRDQVDLFLFGSQCLKVTGFRIVLVRGALPRTLQPVFAAWRKPPRELAEEVAELAKDPKVIPTLAKHCLDIKLDPELVPPVREQLLLLAGTAP